jgi:hypothetical protein
MGTSKIPSAIPTAFLTGASRGRGVREADKGIRSSPGEPVPGSSWVSIPPGALPTTSKDELDGVLALLGSEKTAPNPRVPAGVVVPGAKAPTSVVAPPGDVGSRSGLKAGKMLMSGGRVLPRPIAVDVGSRVPDNPSPGQSDDIECRRCR